MSNKVLIITYYWPPAGGPGVQRWLKFVKYLPDYNIEPIIYCPKNPNYAIIDQGLVHEVPKGITVIKQSIKEPYKFANFLSRKSSKSISSGLIPKKDKQSLLEKFLLYIRGNYFIPDGRKAWVKPSVTFLSEYIQKNNIETIITTGPPHSLHLIGMHLKQEIGVKWLADFRDPWTTIGYHKALKLTKTSQKKHMYLEQKVLNTADQILVTSEVTKKEFQLKTENPIEVITNGYDTHYVPKPVKDLKFSIAHIGSLLSERNPKLLWKSLKELIKENKAFKEAFQLNLIGVVSDEVLKSIYENDLKEVVNLMGYVDHKEAIKLQMQSRVLLLIEIDSEDTKAIIPGKLFEYMVAESPILAIGPKGSDIEQIIKSTNTGCYFTYDQIHDIKSQILAYFEAYKNNTLTTSPIGLKQYSRKELTSKLAKLI